MLGTPFCFSILCKFYPPNPTIFIYGLRDFLSQIYESLKIFKLQVRKISKKKEISCNKNSFLFQKDYFYIQPPSVCQRATFHFHIFIGSLLNSFYWNFWYNIKKDRWSPRDKVFDFCMLFLCVMIGNKQKSK